MTQTFAPSRVVVTTSRGVHVAIAAIIAASLVIQLVLLFTGGADANSGFVDREIGPGVRLARLFSYFTIDSNLIVLVVATLVAVDPWRDGKVWRIVRLDALLSIVIAGLVFAVVLARQVHLTGWALVATIGFHYVSPWLTLAAWLIFGPRPRFTWSAVAWAFVWPAVWLSFIFARGAATGWYPYPFLDAAALGFAVALRNALFVLLTAILLSAIIKLIDQHVPAVLSARVRRDERA